MLRRAIVLTLAAVLGMLALQAAPAAATPTCVTGAACVLTLRGTQTMTIRTGAGVVSETCDISFSVDVIDGNTAMSSRSITVGRCASTANCVPGTFQPLGSVWTFNLVGSRAPFPLDVTIPTAIAIQCGMAGRILLQPTSCLTGGGAIANFTPGATVTVTMSCPVPFVAGGMITMITGAAGTATLTLSLSGTTDGTRDGVTIS